MTLSSTVLLTRELEREGGREWEGMEEEREYEEGRQFQLLLTKNGIVKRIVRQTSVLISPCIDKNKKTKSKLFGQYFGSKYSFSLPLQNIGPMPRWIALTLPLSHCIPLITPKVYNTQCGSISIKISVQAIVLE